MSVSFTHLKLKEVVRKPKTVSFTHEFLNSKKSFRLHTPTSNKTAIQVAEAIKGSNGYYFSFIVYLIRCIVFY